MKQGSFRQGRQRRELKGDKDQKKNTHSKSFTSRETKTKEKERGRVGEKLEVEECCLESCRATLRLGCLLNHLDLLVSRDTEVSLLVVLVNTDIRVGRHGASDHGSSGTHSEADEEDG